MSPYLMFGAIAAVAAITGRRARPTGQSGRSITDNASTIEGQQNRNYRPGKGKGRVRNCGRCMKAQ